MGYPITRGTTNQAPMLANEGTNRTILMGGGSDRALRQGLGGTVGHPCPHSTPRHHLNPWRVLYSCSNLPPAPTPAPPPACGHRTTLERCECAGACHRHLRTTPCFFEMELGGCDHDPLLFRFVPSNAFAIFIWCSGNKLAVHLFGPEVRRPFLSYTKVGFFFCPYLKIFSAF